MDQQRVWHLLARKLAGEATLNELRELEQLLTGLPDIAGRTEIHSGYFDKKEPAEEPETMEPIWQRQLKLMRENFPDDFDSGKANPSRSRKKTFLYSAAFSTLLAFLLLAGYLWSGHQQPTGRAIAAAGITELKTPPSDKLKSVLPDGSVVWLNSDSHVRYDSNFGKHNREIMLEGEAFFDVVHKAELPMVVHAGPVDIRVRGTAFNVRSYRGDDKVEASLIRGSIELTITGAAPKKFMLKPNQKITVHIKGNEAAPDPVHFRQAATAPFSFDTLTVESSSGLIPEIAWIENKLVFNSEPLDKLALKLERWYHVTIKISDARLSAERFTGVFENETLTEALNALRLTYRFHYKIEKTQVTISK